MSKFCRLTLGHTLALGDWRALISKQLAAWEIQQIEASAHTSLVTDSSSFSNHSTAIGQAMRARFPVSQGALHNLTFSLKTDEGIPEFLLRCKDTWVNVAGAHPSSSDLHTDLFRRAIMDGMPQPVQQAMKANPDIPGCKTEMWEKHLTHHYRLHKQSQVQLAADQTSAQSQLLKLRLDDARRKATDVKKANMNKSNTQMLQQPALQPPTQPPPQPQPQPPPPTGPQYNYWQPPQQQQYWGGSCSVRGGMRGRGRGKGASYYPRAPPPHMLCFVCGQVGHWARDCRQQPPNQSHWGGYNMGSGPHTQQLYAPVHPPSQPPFHHQAPNMAAAPPQGQFPMTDPRQEY